MPTQSRPSVLGNRVNQVLCEAVLLISLPGCDRLLGDAFDVQLVREAGTDEARSSTGGTPQSDGVIPNTQEESGTVAPGTAPHGDAGAQENPSLEASCAPNLAACAGKCGQILECGKTMDCGGCLAGETCGGAGTPNVCGVGTCTPSCASKGCGESDGCDGLCTQGRCDEGQHCTSGGRCVCDGTSCAGCCHDSHCESGDQQNACGRGGVACQTCAASTSCGTGECGTCGGNGQSCCPGGTCATPLRCGGAGQDGVCGCVPDCTGKACGESDGCGSTCTQGACGSGLHCLNGTCTCDPSSCTGCCAAGQCRVGTSDSLCGRGGAACMQCQGGATCGTGDCGTCGGNGQPCCAEQRCASPLSCGGGGKDGVCGCTPQCAGKACGGSDGCGGTCLQGSCSAGLHCDVGRCTCDATSCSGCCSSGACLNGETDAACGTAGSVCLSCSSSNRKCSAHACVTPTCTATTPFCDGNAVKKCGSDGMTTSVVDACTTTEYCDGPTAACKPQVCSPNLPVCNNDNAVASCNADGSGYLASSTPCGSQYCSGDRCVAPMFLEAFETKPLDGWKYANGDETGNADGARIVTQKHAVGVSSLEYKGMWLDHAFASPLKPRGMGSWMMVPSTAPCGCSIHLCTGGDCATTPSLMEFGVGTNGTWAYAMGTSGEDAGLSVKAGTWIHLELRNVDWTNRTFDFYVDGVLVKANLVFGASTGIDLLEIATVDWTLVYVDEIVFVP